MPMTWRPFRRVRANRVLRRLSLAAFLVAALAVRAHTNPAGAAGVNDPATAGPANWADDLSPIAAGDWSEARAAHLIERAGFGATPGGGQASGGDDAAAGGR